MADDAPAPEEKKTRGKKSRFTKEDVVEILRRVEAGETRAAVAQEYGVSREAISQIYIRHTKPDAERRPSLRRTKQLTDAEIAAFREALDTTRPRDHGFEFLGHHHPDSWTDARVKALAKKVVGKVPAVRVLKELVTKEHRTPPYDPDAPPPPPEPHDVRRLSPELAQDEEFVEYYLSDKAWQLTLKDYEYQLREWERHKLEREAKALRKADREAKKEAAEPVIPVEPPVAPGLRIGKHRASKGSPFTRAKRKKRR
jgi:hypothetical protein